MNRICFYKEDDTVLTELQKVEVLNTEGAKAKFKVNEKPVYLKIFIFRPLSYHELINLYNHLISYELLKMTDEEVMEAAREDEEKMTPCSWEIRCVDFGKAFDFARTESKIWNEDEIRIQISDEPTESMKKWLEKKGVK